MTFIKLAEKVIREERRPLTPNEIWEISRAKGYDKSLKTEGKTPWASLGARLYVDVRDNPDTKFIKLGSRPVRFFLKEFLNEGNLSYIEPSMENKGMEEIENKETGTKIKLKERDLHKYLTYYLYTYKLIYTKTIFHEESNKRQYSQWIHPDMVGVYYPLEEWEDVVLDISKEIGNYGIKFYSFEIKRDLNFGNLRESYFQAVSNSSWANEGYLVSASIKREEELSQEIKRLNNAFGIGVIELNLSDPDSTEVLFPAKEKDNVDIVTMNKIAQLNPNFKEFLKRVKIDWSSKDIRKEKYDKVFDVEELKLGDK